MKNLPLISASTLYENLGNSDLTLIDCRFSLTDYEAGFKAYRLGHITGAVYADLNKDLSGPVSSLTGRHPLPSIKALSSKLSCWGIKAKTAVVVYDDAGGAFASRLWWLLHYLGHEHVAVLDGGIQQWLKLCFPLTTRLPTLNAASFIPQPIPNFYLTAAEVEAGLAHKTICLIDARAPERYQGRHEPIDPVAGHIPGAVNRPFQANLDNDGLFLPKEKLAADFRHVLGTMPPDHAIHMCGSGVTACHNMLAMEYAGLGGSKLYAGSWSDWITNKNRRISSTLVGKT